MVGLYTFMHHYLKQRQSRQENDYTGADILSISSCEKFIGQKPERQDRSFLRWKDSIFDIYSDSQGQANDTLLEQLKLHLDFSIRQTRVTNLSLTEKAQHISMDKTDAQTREDLKRIGSATAEQLPVRSRHP